VFVTIPDTAQAPFRDDEGGEPRDADTARLSA